MSAQGEYVSARQDAETVRNLAFTKKGAPVTETLLLDFQERLQKSGLFETVSVTLDSDPARTAAWRAVQARATETRSTCPYCSVGCGVIMYSLGDKAKNVTSSIIHIEGDPDHPVNRGTLCPKGAGLLDFVHSPNRLKFPEIREPGSKEWKRVSWDEAMNRLVKMMKADRDANFQATNADGKPVNRWLTTGMLCASASSNESGYITHKAMRSLGMLVFDNQARV